MDEVRIARTRCGLDKGGVRKRDGKQIAIFFMLNKKAGVLNNTYNILFQVGSY